MREIENKSNSVHFLNIPEEIKLLPRWVCSDRVKNLIDPKSGLQASTTDESTWGTFQQACDFFAVTECVKAIGFVFSVDDDIYGVDFDGCIFDGVISRVVQDIIKKFNTYTEKSPSQTGIHLLCHGGDIGFSEFGLNTGTKITLNKKGILDGVEIYKSGRYFTITGDIVSENKILNDCTPSLRKLLFNAKKMVGIEPKSATPTIQKIIKEIIAAPVPDEELMPVILKIETARDLFDGIYAPKFPSPSEADGALLTILAKYCNGNADQMERLFKTSKLYSQDEAKQAKFDAIRGGGLTFLEGQVQSAIGHWEATGKQGYLHNQEVTFIINTNSTSATKSLVCSSLPEDNGDSLFSGARFPLIVSAKDFIADKIPAPREIIKGLLHQGEKGSFGGPSKAFKTHNLMHMGLAVAAGVPWMNFDTICSRALYINFELMPYFMQHRLITLSRRLMITDWEKNFDVWNLRGNAVPLTELISELMQQIEGEGYSLIIPDPIYKTLVGRKENAAEDVAQVCNEIEQVAMKTGACVLFGNHFAKGNASLKNAEDRVSGSGVWARDPDVIITATPHEEDGCFAFDFRLRNMPPINSFVVKWDYPLFVKMDGKDPNKLKGARGRPKEYAEVSIENYVKDGMTTTQWLKAVSEETGMCRSRFFECLKNLVSSNIIKDSTTKKWTVLNEVKTDKSDSELFDSKEVADK